MGFLQVTSTIVFYITLKMPDYSELLKIKIKLVCSFAVILMMPIAEKLQNKLNTDNIVSLNGNMSQLNP